MLKLKYLFDNRDLAMMLLANWHYDSDNLDIMDCYRISANAVYPFSCGGKTNVIRFSPLVEKPTSYIEAELGFISYLDKEGYSVVQAIPSKDGNTLLQKDTPWGECLSVAFKGVDGKLLSECDYSEELFGGYGRTLGNLHNLSRKYIPKGDVRPCWADILDWCESTIKECNGPGTAIKEATSIRKGLERLPVSSDNYGLVHYDFELDNVFYDHTTGIYTPIDFDDAVYRWYAMDIVQAVDSIQDGLPEEQRDTATEAFQRGYMEVSAIDSAIMAQLPLLGRYANLLGFTRCLRTTHEQWENEPDWMIELRQMLDKMMIFKATQF